MSAALFSAPPPPDLDPAALAAANINSQTGLATDYLNHYNEVAMLLQLAPECPELAEEVLAWAPISYDAHFHRTGFRDKELALAAYAAAAPVVRLAFTRACLAIDAALADAQARLSGGAADLTFAAGHAQMIFDLIAEAGAVIHGGVSAPEPADQDAIDALFR